MKDVSEFFKEDKWGYSDYNLLIQTFGFNIVDFFDEADYQGDSWYVLNDGKRYGFLTFGWGSCSGCDAMQACNNLDDLRDLQWSLFQGIVWYDSLEDLQKWMKETDWTTKFNRPSKEFIDGIINMKP